jgi:fatty-acyl-CoA synthase
MFVPLLVTDFSRKAAKQYWKKVGVVDGEKRFTYAQFGERVNRLSNSLLNLGIKKGDRVAVIDTNSHRLLEMYFGIPQIGAILLPINIRLTPKDIAYVLNDSEAKCLIVNQDLVHMVIVDRLESTGKFILMRDGPSNEDSNIQAEEYEELLSKSSPVMEKDFEIDENDPAEMFYTSGTTAQPKGMFHTHRTLYLSALKDLFYGGTGGLSDSTVYLHAIPLFHANGWRMPHTITALGARHVMVRQFRPEVICDLIQKEKVTHVDLVPTMADMLTSCQDIKNYDLSTVQRIAVGGAAMSKATHERLIEEFPGAMVIAGWGMSETASAGTAAVIKDYLEELPEEEKRRKMRSQGFEDYVSQIRVVDSNGNDVIPDGKHAGEIIMRGNCVIDGYWRLPEATRNTIIDGWLHTGDVATIDEDGYVQIVDRLKDLIISGGENIGSIEIEDVISSHPAVLEVAVVAAPDGRWGETPGAVVVLKEGAHLTEQELIAYCRKSLAGFKIPRMVQFLDSLPKGGTGKILKSQIKEEFWKGHERRVVS